MLVGEADSYFQTQNQLLVDEKKQQISQIALNETEELNSSLLNDSLEDVPPAQKSEDPPKDVENLIKSESKVTAKDLLSKFRLPLEAEGN